MGLQNPMRDYNGRQELGRRRADTCYHGLSSRLESRSVCNIYIYISSNNIISCEFDEFRVDSHLGKLRTTSVARFYLFVEA